MKKTILKLKEDTINDILFNKNKLLLKKNEYSGTFNFGGKTCSKSSCFKVSFGVNSIKGNKCYSNIPTAKINFHTHPISCYRDTRSIWGWPSGMDMKAAIKLQDNEYHIVFALEGTYIISIPAIIKDNINKSDLDYIGELFSETHEFRCIEDYDAHGNNFKKLFKLKYKTNNPLEIWLKFVNNYKIKINNKPVKVFNVKFVPNISFQYICHPDISFDIINNINSKNINKFVKCSNTINLASNSV